ncbi:nucleobase-ascorbate transporter 4 [Diospyros lotus]|uniref:nucleobase-ascorbate transporter 4 n=1 Tax=Diospyros lotus TaxID=55363 RepID=UPI00225C2A97|nr:nucleobase-ascorbate transporter 4 [Diospyros lotus]
MAALVPHPVKEQLPGVDFCVNSNPAWPAAIIVGFQHYIVMLGTTVLIPSIIVPLMGGGNREKAEVIQTLLFVAGINTLLQTWFGTRLPVVIGASYAFVFPALFVVLSNRYSTYIDPHDRFRRSMRGIQGALLIASVLPILAGFFGVWRILVRLLCPLSSVPLITLVGLGLYAHGFPQLAQCVEIGLPELIILIILSQYIPQYIKTKGGIFERFFERYAVLISIAIVWAYAALLTAAGAYKNRPPNTQFSCRVDRAGLIGGAPWIRFPYPWQWGAPTVNAGEVFVMAAAAFVALIESTGAFKAAARYGSATPIPPSVISRGAGWLGIAILLDGFFGTVSGSTVSVENVGLLALTRVGSRRVVQISAVFMIFFSIFGKFGAVLASIPLPIFGALYCILFGYVSSAGLGLLQYCNLNSFRTMFIIGFSLFMGLSVPQYFNGYVVTSGHGPVHTRSSWFNEIMQVIFTSPATVAAIVGVFLDSTIARRHSLTRVDSGRHWWEKFRYFDKDPRSEEFYALPWGLSRHFPSV